MPLARLYLLHVAEKKISANSFVYSRTFLTQVSLLIHLNVPFLTTNFTLKETLQPLKKIKPWNHVARLYWEDELIHSRHSRRELFLALLTLLCPENNINYFSVLTMQTKQEAPHHGLITAIAWVESRENYNTTSVKSLSWIYSVSVFFVYAKHTLFFFWIVSKRFHSVQYVYIFVVLN